MRRPLLLLDHVRRATPPGDDLTPARAVLRYGLAGLALALAAALLL